MNKNNIIAGVGFGLVCASLQSASAFEIQFNGLTGTGATQMQFVQPTTNTTTHVFTPGSVSFTTRTTGTVATGKNSQWQENSVNGGPGDSINDYGSVTGSYSVGYGSYSASTTVLSTSGATVKIQVTENIGVSGTGGLKIRDASGVFLTGNAVMSTLTDTYTCFSNRTTHAISGLTVGSIGFTGNGAPTTSGLNLNVTGIQYAGSQQDLQILANGDKVGGKGRAQLSFAWTAGGSTLKSLAGMVSNTGATTKTLVFSGDIQSDAHPIPDGGMTITLLGVAFTGIALVRRGKSA